MNWIGPIAAVFLFLCCCVCICCWSRRNKAKGIRKSSLPTNPVSIVHVHRKDNYEHMNIVKAEEPVTQNSAGYNKTNTVAELVDYNPENVAPSAPLQPDDMQPSVPMEQDENIGMNTNNGEEFMDGRFDNKSYEAEGHHGINDNEKYEEVKRFFYSKLSNSMMVQDMNRYFEMFKRNGFDTMDTIKTLTNQDLIDIGVDKLGHRKIILAQLQLKETNY
eukprot:143164_1